MKYQVWHYNEKSEREVLQYFDTYNEAYEYANKVADQNILARINELCDMCNKFLTECNCDFQYQEYIENNL